MIALTMSANEVREQLAAVLAKLQETQQPVLITEHGKAEAVLLSVEQYAVMRSLLEDRDDELDKSLGQRLNEERAAYLTGEGRDFETFLTELE
jgi:prevent-host-death family protein